mmetsp:Transcript_25972/g.71533  ORF Transcript_25972/g.71533 Transcript_25972/m.71533 type:complete len:246 (+) Transcript_25972:506-1243(+)
MSHLVQKGIKHEQRHNGRQGNDGQDKGHFPKIKGPIPTQHKGAPRLTVAHPRRAAHFEFGIFAQHAVFALGFDKAKTVGRASVEGVNLEFDAGVVLVRVELKNHGQGLHVKRKVFQLKGFVEGDLAHALPPHEATIFKVGLLVILRRAELTHIIGVTLRCFQIVFPLPFRAIVGKCFGNVVGFKLFGVVQKSMVLLFADKNGHFFSQVTGKCLIRVGHLGQGKNLVHDGNNHFFAVLAESIGGGR